MSSLGAVHYGFPAVFETESFALELSPTRQTQQGWSVLGIEIVEKLAFPQVEKLASTIFRSAPITTAWSVHEERSQFVPLDSLSGASGQLASLLALSNQYSIGIIAPGLKGLGTVWATGVLSDRSTLHAVEQPGFEKKISRLLVTPGPLLLVPHSNWAKLSFDAPGLARLCGVWSIEYFHTIARREQPFDWQRMREMNEHVVVPIPETRLTDLLHVLYPGLINTHDMIFEKFERPKAALSEEFLDRLFNFYGREEDAQVVSRLVGAATSEPARRRVAEEQRRAIDNVYRVDRPRLARLYAKAWESVGMDREAEYFWNEVIGLGFERLNPDDVEGYLACLHRLGKDEAAMRFLETYRR